VQPSAGPRLTFDLDTAALPAPGQPIVLRLRPEAMSLLAA